VLIYCLYIGLYDDIKDILVLRLRPKELQDMIKLAVTGHAFGGTAA